MAPHKASQENFISNLSEIVNNHLSNPDFGVSELSREIRMSRSNLHRKVKTITGLSASRYISKIRLEKAREMLNGSSQPISEIAFESGFHSVAYFSRCYREQYGYPPGEERNNHQPIPAAENNKPERYRHIHVHRGIFITIVVIAALLIAITTIIVSSQPFKNLFPAREISIAVLPFRNDSPGESEMYFINGTMEEIITHLGNISGIQVVSRMSVEQYRDHPRPVTEIARELNVKYVLEGSGLRAGDSIRLNLVLIDAVNDHQIWSASFKRHISELFELQSQIALVVAEELKATISPEEQRIIEIPPSRSQIAYEFYLRGTEEYGRFEKDRTNLAALDRAENLTRYALEKDPDFVRAVVRMGWIYSYRYGLVKDAPVSSLDSMRKYAFLAVTLDEQDEEAIYLRGNYFYKSGMMEDAARDYRRLLVQSPDQKLAYAGLGWAAYALNDMVEAVSNLHRAALLSPGDPIAMISLANALLKAGFKEESDEWYRRAMLVTGDSATYLYQLGQTEQFISRDLDKALSMYMKGYSLDSSQIDCLFGMGSVYMEKGAYEKSFPYMERYRDSLLTRSTFNPFRTMVLGFVYQKSGKAEMARELFDEQVIYSNRMFSRDPNTHITLAITYAQTGNEERAMDHLRSLNQITRYGIYIIRNLEDDLFFTTLQDDPEFQQIRSEINLKYRAEHERVRKWMMEIGVF